MALIDGLKLKLLGSPPSVSTLARTGSSDGLSATGSQFWHQGLAEIPDQPEAGDEFGFALAAGG